MKRVSMMDILADCQSTAEKGGEETKKTYWKPAGNCKLMLTRQFLRASVAVEPGPTETAYWSKETSKMVPVASMLTQAWPAGQPEPMALTLMILTSEGDGAGGTRT